MKKLIFLFIFSASVVFSTIRADSFNVENYSDADRLFSWAERTHPTLFSPANGTSQVWENWYYRYYSDTKNYVGVNTDSLVYVTGKSFDGLLYIDTLEALLVEVDKKPVITGRLNDTGTVYCANLDNNGLTCPVDGLSGQDAEHGRDVTHNDDSDGHAGFSFTKLDADGIPLPASARNWSCVKDNVTGLVWEMKTNDGGLHDSGHTYTWYNTDDSKNGGGVAVREGKANGGDCTESDCDTQGYVQAVNVQGLCGANSWRLPTREELRSIVYYSGIYNDMVDRDYFTHSLHNISYWSSSVHAFQPDKAWGIYFDFGIDGHTHKSSKTPVILVRDEH